MFHATTVSHGFECLVQVIISSKSFPLPAQSPKINHCLLSLSLHILHCKIPPFPPSLSSQSPTLFHRPKLQPVTPPSPSQCPLFLKEPQGALSTFTCSHTLSRSCCIVGNVVKLRCACWAHVYWMWQCFTVKRCCFSGDLEWQTSDLGMCVFYCTFLISHMFFDLVYCFETCFWLSFL